MRIYLILAITCLILTWVLMVVLGAHGDGHLLIGFARYIDYLIAFAVLMLVLYTATVKKK